MKEKTFSVISVLVLLSAFTWAQGIRKPVCAGSWYDQRKEVLSGQLDSFLERAEIQGVPTDSIMGIVVPHAGYAYSGQVAAHAYRLVQGKDYETVIIVGTSHRFGFNGCSIYLQGGYQTPLGIAEVDEDLAGSLSKSTGFRYIADAHREEHSVEMQVPFVQKVLPGAKIVPIVMGIPSKKTISALANGFAETLVGRNVLIIASTDLSHFLSKEKANSVDKETIALIEALDVEKIIKKLGRNENIMCGGGPVSSMILFAKKAGNPHGQVLKYMDSSQVGGAEDRVVGYVSAAVYADKSTPPFSLSSEEKEELLSIARSAVALYVSEKKVFSQSTQNPRLLSKRGVFVTLKKKGRLRGCIGFIESNLPLHQAVVQAAVYAASRDVRFNPVQSSELKDIEVEISVLTPLRKIANSEEVEVGKHGLLISKYEKRGLLLPQVPVENHWSRQAFLEQTCLKAGLPQDAWKSGADLYVFEAIVFH
ncbi:MAG: AmmeMemoRadiSam system protein B [Candidatus Aminicenantes bacterium]|nr:AmmeMemoRadiSam system protein B [Candidatus Aminicenantes bacterium]